MRGKQKVDRIGKGGIRITPAGAGKTLEFQSYAMWEEDHPRRCGETLLSVFVSMGSPGSPPQVRGKPETNPAGQSRMRITPAGAGKT